MNQFTPEQEKRMRKGCMYVLIKTLFTLLLTAVFILIVPLLGNMTTLAITLFSLLGMVAVAMWVAKLVYPKDPLGEFRNEIKEHDLP